MSTSANMGFAASARDVTLSFDGACNCCNCCEETPPKNALVYVTSRGRIELFSPTKSYRSTNESLKRSVEHLNRHITHVGHLTFNDPQALRKRAEREIGVSLDPATPQVIKYESVEKLNELFERTLNP